MQTIKRPTGSVFDKPKANGLDTHTLREVIDIGNNQIWPIVQRHLSGRPAPIQSAILAHVTSLWLSAYAVNGSAVVEPMLVGYISLVRQLLTLNSRVIGQMLDKVHSET